MWNSIIRSIQPLSASLWVQLQYKKVIIKYQWWWFMMMLDATCNSMHQIVFLSLKRFYSSIKACKNKLEILFRQLRRKRDPPPSHNIMKWIIQTPFYTKSSIAILKLVLLYNCSNFHPWHSSHHIIIIIKSHIITKQ